MKKIKAFICLFTVLIMFASFTAVASAKESKESGVVDINKIIDNYAEAQKVAAELKVKEADLQKFVMDAQKKVRESKSPVEQKNLEEKYGEEFNIKRNALINEQTEKWDAIENKIYKAVEDLAAVKKLDMVFTKQAVIVGGIDITEELIKKLNEVPAKK